MVEQAPEVRQYSQLLHQGWTRHLVEGSLRSGELIRVARGVYAHRERWGGEERDRLERQHRLLTTGLLSRLDDRAAASHHSGAVLLGLPVWGVDWGVVHVTRVDDDHRRARQGVRVHQHCPGQTVTITPDGWPVLSVADCVVGTGMGSGARPARPISALIAADHALRMGLTSHAELFAAADRLRGYRGIAPVREALLLADGRHESPGETRLAYICHDARLPVTPQVELVVEGRDYRCDLLLDEAPVIVEMDGLGKYFLENSSGSVDPVRALKAEKAREDALRRAGYGFVRVTWDELAQPMVVVGRIHRAIAAVTSAGRRSA